MHTAQNKSSPQRIHTHTPPLHNKYRIENKHLHTKQNAVLQPWTPCLPIRGGKLRTSKNYSTSNPQLSFSSCGSTSFLHNNRTANTSNNSLNSSYIWREASPNNFNLYSTSVSSLNAPGALHSSLPPSASSSPYRYSIGSTQRPNDCRSVSEEKSTPRKSNKFKASATATAAATVYENVCTAPLLPQRKQKYAIKIVKSGQDNVNVGRRLSTEFDLSDDPMPYGLYDRRRNRSFESGGGVTGNDFTNRNNVNLRRSTPHLATDDLYANVDPIAMKSDRHSNTWCCGNFMKQWKKVHQYDWIVSMCFERRCHANRLTWDVKNISKMPYKLRFFNFIWISVILVRNCTKYT